MIESAIIYNISNLIKYCTNTYFNRCKYDPVVIIIGNISAWGIKMCIYIVQNCLTNISNLYHCALSYLEKQNIKHRVIIFQG